MSEPKNNDAVQGLNFLFVYEDLKTLGGVEVLIARMAEWLIVQGHSVSLLVRSAGLERRLLPDGLKICELGDKFDEICFYWRAKKIWSQLGLPTPAVIKTFDAKPTWIGTILSIVLSPQPKLVIGSYGPFFVQDRKMPFRNWHGRFLLRNVERNVDPRSRVFMNIEQLNQFKEAYGAEKDGVIWHLPVDETPYLNVARNPKYGALLSVGRLARMKGYNLYMIEVVKRLVKKGYDVTWTVYGDGPLEEQVKTKVVSESLQDRIFLKGRLEHSDFGKVLSDAYLFVGMGTAIIEASYARVPGVVAIANDVDGITYGPIYKFPPGNCGELTETAPACTVEGEVERILRFSSSEYESEAQRVWEYAQCYSMGHQMAKFMEIVNRARPAKRDIAMIGFYYVYALYNYLRRSFRYRSVKL
jgi:glycosyltransferase involved in cell wall biosynthesis